MKKIAVKDSFSDKDGKIVPASYYETRMEPITRQTRANTVRDLHTRSKIGAYPKTGAVTYDRLLARINVKFMVETRTAGERNEKGRAIACRVPRFRFCCSALCVRFA